MAEAIISGAVNQLSIFIKDQGLELIRAALGVEKEIKNLSSKLNKIKAVLVDAERRSFEEERVKLWVEEIKELCYDVEDVVDEWSTRSRRQQMERSSQVSAGSCCSFLLAVFSCFHFKRFVMHGDIANKIKELDSRLDRITKEKDQFNFLAVANTSASASLHRDQELKRVTTPFDVDAIEIQGRESDASALISKLVEDNKNGPPVVISIVGAGGIGKTTLAQLVYGDERIKAHFDERVWVCVSQPFDQIKIAKAIVQSTTKSSEDLSDRLQVLLEKIQTTLSQKRFLLVLDDVWTEEDTKWAPFKNSLKAGLPGSRILVTSRSERVARMMASVYLHRVDLISDSDAWLLLSKIAFSGGRDDAYSKKLEKIGEQIAQKCKGLPLAVKVMGSLLRNKDTEEEWQTVLSQLDTKFSNVEGVETHLFPHLRLSYDDLTPQMKRCFSYCAVFPKDYRIHVDELIRIWMAQGYLTTTNGNDHNHMEQKGREIFGNLAMRSLYQDFKKDDMDSKIIISCYMHDIVHDFAEFLTKNECCSVDLKENKVKIENLRHLSWQKTGRPMDLASICDVLGKLHSFFAEDLSPEQLLSNMFNLLKSVRVLGLQRCMLQKLPKEIGDLLHLRYIDLSWSKVEELPYSICTLYNLETLNLRGCECLSRLPQQIGNLCNLRMIDLTLTKVEEFPDSIFSLNKLQTLNLCECECLSRLPEGVGNLCNLSKIGLSWSKVEELPDSICTLYNLETLNLMGCKCLSRLPQQIGNLCNLRMIDLSLTKVEEFPDSICSLDNLQTLKGSKCLSRLPEGIGNLRHLREIDLSESKVEELPNAICTLVNLQTLNLKGCQFLSRLPKGIGNLRHLRKINIGLTKVEELPDSICYLDNIQTLYLGGCQCLSKLPERIGNMRQLKSIHLRGCIKVKELPDSICSLDNLEILNLEGCECLSRLPEGIGNLCHLREIDLRRSKVEELPDSICSLDNLKILNLKGCECLSRLPEAIGNLHQLRRINLSECKVEELPNSIWALDNLESLNLAGCQCLSRLHEGIGNLRHLSMIDLSRCKVEELPNSIWTLDNLKFLNLAGCQCLSRLPEGIGNLRHLIKIDLSRSTVEELPDSICSLDYLESLNLAGCQFLSKLPEGIGNLCYLSDIYLSRSKVEELPDSICSLVNLETLDLDGCECLSRLPEGIGNLHHLRRIDLSECKVEELPNSICSLDNLQSLNLAGCKCLSRLPEGIGNLRYLSDIDLSRSKVEELPESICSLDNLEILDLKGCECLSRLPDGIGNLQQLRFIDLRGCKVELPDSIYSLNNLKIRVGELDSDLSE